MEKEILHNNDENAKFCLELCPMLIIKENSLFDTKNQSDRFKLEFHFCFFFHQTCLSTQFNCLIGLNRFCAITHGHL